MTTQTLEREKLSIADYETDILAWANEQAWLIRNRQFDLLDIDRIAEEIEDVGKSEQRELANRIVILIAHLLKWKFQPERQGRSWLITIRNQRKAIDIHLKEVPSLKVKLNDTQWLDVVWGDAVYLASKETGLDIFPEKSIWSTDDILSESWLPA
ncbi:MAG: DUF29 domain-containing protein [Desulfamplus sp.]|nr:DUF29 domain-containing protein [Desulfamplus sp.]MBF0390192.1 DUF29 domain-containing protein [Desulfamplus sp.]